MVKISKELAENLLDDINELLSNITDLRKYDRYKKRCIVYENEIAELKTALIKEKSITPPEERDCNTCIHDGECYVTMIKCKGYKKQELQKEDNSC